MAQRKSAAVVLGVTALLAPVLTGCGGEDESEYQAVCIDPRTEVRLDDEQCDDDDDPNHVSSSGGGWYFINTGGGGRQYPAVGSRVTGLGSRARPSTSYTRGGVPKAGGSVPRGGFGGGTKAGSSGG